jgi:hypothetical protein
MKFLLPLFLLFNILGFSQAKSEYTINYNEKIDFGNVSQEVSFTIYFNNSIQRFNGSLINYFIFSKPGAYQINVVENIEHKENECGHNHFPKMIKVYVSNVKMTFDTSNLKFFEPITKNKETLGNYITIPVVIESNNNEPIILNKTPVNVSGIGSEIIAILDEKFNKLSPGNYILKYNLSGKVTENSYLMFDFLDTNGLVQTASLLTPIQN